MSTPNMTPAEREKRVIIRAGLFIALGSWTVSWSNHVKSELVVKVNFKDSATLAQRNDYARMLQQSPYVKVGGIKYVVAESLDELLAKVRDFRGQVIATAYAFESAPAHERNLRVVTPDDSDLPDLARAKDV